MNRYGVVVVLVFAFASSAFGVDFGKSVDWSKFCPSVKSVAYKGCPVVHPTSFIFNKDPSLYYNSEGRTWETYVPNCEREAKEYKKLTNPRIHHQDKWYHCQSSFENSFFERRMDFQLVQQGKRDRSFFDEKFQVWRDRNL